MIVAAAVEGPPQAAPPSSPAIGACYIVGASPSGAWAGKAQQLATYTSGGWRFVAPRDGLNAYVKTSGATAAFRGTAWVMGDISVAQLSIDGVKVIGARGAAITAPVGGATVDVEARTVIGSILAALRTHGLIAT